MNWKIVLAAVALLVIAGGVYWFATQMQTQTPAGNTNFTAHLGEKVAGGDVYVTLTNVVEDSRCPADVQCVQAGTVRVGATVESLIGGQSTTTLQLGAPVDVGADTILLTSVAPDKYSGRTINPNSYQFVFQVNK
jgi:hypothetical protein